MLHQTGPLSHTEYTFIIDVKCDAALQKLLNIVGVFINDEIIQLKKMQIHRAAFIVNKYQGSHFLHCSTLKTSRLQS